MTHVRKAPSVKALMTIKNITRADAEKIRTVWKTIENSRQAREAVDSILRTYGVVYIGRHKRTGRNVYYANTGETYARTVIFSGPRAYVSCWGDIVEKNLIIEA